MLFRSALGINFQLAKDHAEALLNVQSDRADAFALDDVLLYSFKATSRTPDSYEVVGEALQVEPYACMVRKNDPKFKELVDGVIVGMMKSGQFAQNYQRWFMQAIPPHNVTLGFPMGDMLKENIQNPTDKPMR